MLNMAICRLRPFGRASRAFATGQHPAAKLFSADEARKNLLLEPSTLEQLKSDRARQVSVIVGPSRQGKSHLANILTGRHAFDVSGDPFEAKTFGAWCATSAHGHLVIDTEGQSHQVTESTKKLFCAAYPLATDFVFSTKTAGDDDMFKLMELLASTNPKYKEIDDGMKPRLLLVLRDADSFDFTNFDDALQEEIVPKLRSYQLFSSIHGFAVPALKSVLPGSTETTDLGDLSKLLLALQEPHGHGPLLNINDIEALQDMIRSVNEAGSFDPFKMLAVLMKRLGGYALAGGSEDDQTNLASNHGWDSNRLLESFEHNAEAASRLVKALPSAGETLETLKEEVHRLAKRIGNKQPVYTTRTVEVIKYKTEYYSVYNDNAVKTAAVTVATVVGTGVLCAVNPAVGLATRAAVAAYGAGFGAFIGGAAAEGATIKRRSREVPYTTTEQRTEQVGWKLGNID